MSDLVVHITQVPALPRIFPILRQYCGELSLAVDSGLSGRQSGLRGGESTQNSIRNTILSQFLRSGWLERL